MVWICLVLFLFTIWQWSNFLYLLYYVFQWSSRVSVLIILIQSTSWPDCWDIPRPFTTMSSCKFLLSQKPNFIESKTWNTSLLIRTSSSYVGPGSLTGFSYSIAFCLIICFSSSSEALFIFFYKAWMGVWSLQLFSQSPAWAVASFLKPSHTFFVHFLPQQAR